MTKLILNKTIIKYLLVVSLIGFLPVASNVSPLNYTGASVEAADDDRKKKKKRKRSKMPSKKAQKLFQQLQPMLEAEMWDDALLLLTTIEEGEKFTNTDRATMW